MKPRKAEVMVKPRPLLGPFLAYLHEDGDRLELRVDERTVGFNVEDPSRTLRALLSPRVASSRLLERMRQVLGAPA